MDVFVSVLLNGEGGKGGSRYDVRIEVVEGVLEKRM